MSMFGVMILIVSIITLVNAVKCIFGLLPRLEISETQIRYIDSGSNRVWKFTDIVRVERLSHSKLRIFRAGEPEPVSWFRFSQRWNPDPDIRTWKLEPDAIAGLTQIETRVKASSPYPR